MAVTAQRTLRRTVPCAGIGLHSGQKVTLSLKPAPADYGIRFRRADLGGVEIPARVSHLGGGQQLQTGLMSDKASVETVEHLLAALRSLGIDNVLVELNHFEVPIMDGSSAPWVYLIQDAGIKELAAPRRTIADPAADSGAARRQAHRALSGGRLQDQLHDQLRPPAAAPPAEDASTSTSRCSSTRLRRRARSGS